MISNQVFSNFSWGSMPKTPLDLWVPLELSEQKHHPIIFSCGNPCTESTQRVKRPAEWAAAGRFEHAHKHITHCSITVWVPAASQACFSRWSRFVVTVLMHMQIQWSELLNPYMSHRLLHIVRSSDMIEVRPDFVNSLLPVHCPHPFQPPASKLINYVWISLTSYAHVFLLHLYMTLAANWSVINWQQAVQHEQSTILMLWHVCWSSKGCPNDS